MDYTPGPNEIHGVYVLNIGPMRARRQPDPPAHSRSQEESFMESPIQRGRPARRLLWVGLLPALLIGLLPAAAEAQYFGRNKVQYDNFDFKILPTTHFNIHFYPEEADAVEDAARMPHAPRPPRRSASCHPR